MKKMSENSNLQSIVPQSALCHHHFPSPGVQQKRGLDYLVTI